MFRVRSQVCDGFAIAENDWTPFNTVASGDADRFAAAGDVNTRNMAAIDVFFGAATIGIEDHGLLIGRETPLLYFAISRREKCWIFLFFSVPSQRVKMLPAIFSARDYKAVGSPIEHSATVRSHLGKGVVQFFSAVPDFMRGGARSISDPDSPRLGNIRRDEKPFRLIAGHSRSTDEGDEFAVTRPARSLIGIDRRR